MARAQVKLANENAKISIKSSIESVKLSKEQISNDIKDIESNNFKKPSTIFLNGMGITYDCVKFTEIFTGRVLNETEKNEALLEIKKNLIASLNNVNLSLENLNLSLKNFE